MMTPDSIERGMTLLTAAARYDELRARDALAPPPTGDPRGPGDDSASADPAEPADAADPAGGGPAPLSQQEALELLALGEVIARKASYGRQLAVRTARAGGASWSQIGAAVGASKQAAWEAHTRWIEEQSALHRERDYEGMDDDWAAAARGLAGAPPSPAVPLAAPAQTTRPARPARER